MKILNLILLFLLVIAIVKSDDFSYIGFAATSCGACEHYAYNGAWSGTTYNGGQLFKMSNSSIITGGAIAVTNVYGTPPTLVLTLMKNSCNPNTPQLTNCSVVAATNSYAQCYFSTNITINANVEYCLGGQPRGSGNNAVFVPDNDVEQDIATHFSVWTNGVTEINGTDNSIGSKVYFINTATPPTPIFNFNYTSFYNFDAGDFSTELNNNTIMNYKTFFFLYLNGTFENLAYGSDVFNCNQTINQIFIDNSEVNLSQLPFFTITNLTYNFNNLSLKCQNQYDYYYLDLKFNNTSPIPYVLNQTQILIDINKTAYNNTILILANTTILNNIWGEIKMLGILLINIIFMYIIFWFSTQIHRVLILMEMLPILNIFALLIQYFNYETYFNSIDLNLLQVITTSILMLCLVVLSGYYLIAPKPSKKEIDKSIYGDMIYK